MMLLELREVIKSNGQTSVPTRKEIARQVELMEINRKKEMAGEITSRVLTAPSKYKVGQVIKGYKFLGGDFKDKNNWEKVK